MRARYARPGAASNPAFPAERKALGSTGTVPQTIEHSRCNGRRGDTMKTSKLGVLAASAVLGMMGGALIATSASAEEARACYRTHCGKSITGHEGKCGGTLVSDLTDEKSCEVAGGDWTTAANAKQYAAKK
jgi:hypothetical protein